MSTRTDTLTRSKVNTKIIHLQLNYNEKRTRLKCKEAIYP